MAANFKPTLGKLILTFEAETDFQVDMVAGSTGKLYAQITHGAPYDIFLAADQWRPERLIVEDHAVAGTQKTYALGRLVLWSRSDLQIGLEDLELPKVQRIAIANPNLAPYGTAARQVLQRTNVLDVVSDKLVFGENVGQAFAFVSTSNAQVGFVAEAQIRLLPKTQSGQMVRLDPALHDPIAQDAVLLRRGSDNPAAEAFMTFLHSPKAQDIIARHGYDLP
ncbi:MAG: molybdate ABC transporter substrate-binding protein [Pseudomonadota bacterium]